MTLKNLDIEQIFNINPLPSWICYLKTQKIHHVNFAAIELYEYSKGEFLAFTINDLNHPEEENNILFDDENLKSESSKIHFGIFSHQKKSGELIRIEITGQKVNFEDEKCMFFVGIDVTEKENELKSLKVSEKKLNVISSVAKIGYWKLNLNTQKLTWSDEIYKIWRKNKETFQLTYENFLETIHPSDLKSFEKSQELALQDKVPLNHIHRIILDNNEIRWVHEIGNILRDESGKHIEFEGTVQDITLQKIEEERLKLMESVVTNATDAVLITEAEPFDEPGPKIIYVNDAFTKTTGYTAEEVIGKTPRILQGPKSDRNELARLGKDLREWKSSRVTTINYKKNGEEFWNNFSLTPVANSEGWFTHWISIERDVTDQKNLEFEKELLNKISNCFSEEEELNVASKRLCKEVSDYGNFDLVELWCPNLEQNFIQLIASHAKNESFYNTFDDVNSFKKGIGMPGRVWESSTSLLWNEKEINDYFIRKGGAKNIGLKSVMGLPLEFKNEIVGVLLIGTSIEGFPLTGHHSKTPQKLKKFLASEIYRKLLESDLKQIYNTIPDILCVMDFCGRFLKINGAGCDLLGFSENEILYESLHKFIHPEDQEKVIDEIKKLEERKINYQFECRFVTKDEKIIWLNWHCTSDLKDRLIFSAAKNITEEKKLKELNRNASVLSKVGFWEIDLENSKLYWSDLVYELHETDPENFVPNLENGINLYREEFREMVKEKIAHAIKTGEGYDFEAIKITLKQNERWFRSMANVERLNGVTKRIYGSFQDIHDRKINEIVIQEGLKSLEDYKFALDQSASITISDPSGIIIAVNDQFCKLSKYSREELIGNSHKIINSKYHSKAFFAELWGTISAGKVWRGEVKNKAKDGSYYWADSTVVPFLDKNNKPFQYVAIRIDITSKKLANEKIIKILEEKNDILESISDGFYAVDKEWIVTYWNKKAEELNGIKREDIIGKHFWEIFQDAKDTDFYRNNHLAMETGVSVSYQEYYKTQDKWYEVTVYPSESGLSAYFKDITQKKKSEIDLIEANERFHKVTEATNDAVYDWGLIDDTHYWGIGFETIFGYDLEIEIPSSKLWFDYVHPDDLQRVKQSLFKAIKNPNISKWAEEYRYKKHDESYAYVVDKGIFIRDNEGIATRMVGAITDLTNQKNQELELLALNESLKIYTSELERSNIELEQFAFITSHDLQEPLRMITSFMDQLKRKYENQLDEKALLYINYATDGAKRMKQIILDLLQYSRANRPTDDLENVNLNEIISSYRELRRRIISEKSVIIKSDPLPILNTYKAVFTHIFHGLIDNAIKYSKANVPPIIEIKVTEKEFDWKFSISDNGIGIEAQFFDKIFVLFQRLHNKSEFEGTGIGLSIVKRSVEFLGGKIWLTSKVGEGTTFYFEIKK